MHKGHEQSLYYSRMLSVNQLMWRVLDVGVGRIIIFSTITVKIGSGKNRQ